MAKADWKSPAWLADALRPPADASTLSTKLAEDPQPEPGDLWVVDPFEKDSAGRRIALVLQIDAELGIATSALTSNLVDARTDHDLALPPSETGLSLELLVEADVIGPIWVSQFVTRLGSVDLDLTRRILASGNSQYDELPDRWRGLPIQGQSDPRVAFKDQELASMQRLVAPCLSFLFHSEEIAECDPQFLLPQEVTEEDLIELLSLLEEGTARVPSDLLFELGKQHDYADQWRRRFSWDAWWALQPFLQPSEEAIGSLLTPTKAAEKVSLIPERAESHGASLLKMHLAHSVGTGVRTFALATRPKFWQAQTPTREGKYSIVRMDDKPCAHIVMRSV